MIFEPSDEDIVEAQRQGDITRLLLATAGITPKAPKQRTSSESEAPCYHIRRPGAWPCGTAATGPTPDPCDECRAKTA
ncbi:hypothetical protein ACIQMY_25485 [Streptomyces sp. NPDC091368]|uniref:hypothetical protein n=1 Tax=Streptomyces sp. NPDC091368 TaxID=3365993 RepID=UPI0038261824